MVAVPKSERLLKHISKPLREQMKRRLDRTRWPVLVTYSDEGQGHTGYVYQCSGWEKTERHLRPVASDADGARISTYSNGKHHKRELVGTTWIQRWEAWACARGDAAAWMARHGWRRVRSGRALESGKGWTWVRDDPNQLSLLARS
jgi:hypothetical protein